MPGPGHHSAYMCQDRAVVPYTRTALGKEKVSLRVDVY
jgi:hypothetical protein